MQPPSNAINPSNPWSILDNSEQLQYLFKKYPKLPQQLEEIHAATLPPHERPGIASYEGRPLGKEGRWNAELGRQKGLAALRRARSAPGQEGEALSEYTELIVHLLYVGGENGIGAALEKKHGDEQQQLIRELLEKLKH
jgi:zinc finger HIT domain-containing protein 3